MGTDTKATEKRIKKKEQESFTIQSSKLNTKVSLKKIFDED